MSGQDGRSIMVPVSPGELLDRVSILGIKLERIQDPQKLAGIRATYQLLCRIMDEQGISRQQPLFYHLQEVNAALWQLENAIREKEQAQEFDAEFIRIARAIYRRNDERAALKRAVDLEQGCDVTEVKEYSAY